jgi:peptidoglycan/LPS O-acetylase OafA/YrhL
MTGQSSEINLRTLDALRGLLATYVLMGHARWLLWEGWEKWTLQSHSHLANAVALGSALLRYGHEAVMVFFVLSGFFIHMRSAANLTNTIPIYLKFNFADFFIRRVRRLGPPYVFALLLTWGLDALGRLVYPALYLGQPGDHLLDQTLGRGVYNWTSVGPALAMLPNLLGRSFGSNGPLWSLGYEVIYYWIYPFWFSLRQRFGAGLAYGLGASLLLLPLLKLPHIQVVTNILGHYPIWLAGAGLVEIATNARFKCIWTTECRRATFVVACVVFGIIQQRGIDLQILLPLYLLGGITIVLLVLSLPDSVSHWPITRFWEQLGICSYTIYICHFPILTIMSAFLMSIYGKRPETGLFAATGAVTALVFCSACFFFCEKPFLPTRRMQKRAV